MRITDKRRVKAAVSRLLNRETCDRCVQSALYVAAKEAFILTLCGHHKTRFGAVLTADGWTIKEIASND